MKMLVLAAVSVFAMSAQDMDLAAQVKKGEGWGTSAITQSEIMRCWATWSAIRDHIARLATPA